MINTKITGRLKLYPLKSAKALMKHLQLMLKSIEQQMGDKQRMIDVMSSYEWDVMIDLCEKDWQFLEGCSEEELVDVAEDLLCLPAKMRPIKMPKGIYRELIDVVY